MSFAVVLSVAELLRVGVQLPPVPPDLVALYLHHRRLGLLVVLELVARLRGVVRTGRSRSERLSKSDT